MLPGVLAARDGHVRWMMHRDNHCALKFMAFDAAECRFQKDKLRVLQIRILAVLFRNDARVFQAVAV